MRRLFGIFLSVYMLENEGMERKDECKTYYDSELIIYFLDLSFFQEIRKTKRRYRCMGFADAAKDIVLAAIILIIGGMIIAALLGL